MNYHASSVRTIRVVVSIAMLATEEFRAVTARPPRLSKPTTIVGECRVGAFANLQERYGYLKQRSMRCFDSGNRSCRSAAIQSRESDATFDPSDVDRLAGGNHVVR